MLNKCAFIGFLGKDVECRAMQDGKEIANMSLGVSESWTDKNSGERKSITEWVRVSVFNPHLVKIAKEYLKKGSKIYLEGKLKTRKYTDSVGVEKYSTEVVLDNFGGAIIMLDGKKSEGESYAAPKPHVASPESNSVESDEIPFIWLLPLAFAASQFLNFGFINV